MSGAAAHPARRPMLAAKAVAVVLILLVGLLAVRHSLGLALAGRNPDAALRLDRENAVVRGQAALALLQKSGDPATRAAARELALAALRRDSGNVAALSALGLASDRPSEAARAFTLSEQLSRRSLATQLWLIENAVAQGDVAGALRHYDIALRTSMSARVILFPVLIAAIGDDHVLAALTQTLARRPFWGGLYLQQLAQSGPDRARIVTLFAALKRRGIATGIAADAALYDRLIEVQLFDDAWRLYAVGGAPTALSPPSPPRARHSTGSSATRRR